MDMAAKEEYTKLFTLGGGPLDLANVRSNVASMAQAGGLHGPDPLMKDQAANLFLSAIKCMPMLL
jgi:hypothetical protein